MERATLHVSTHLLLIKGDEILLYKRKGGSQDGKYNVIAGHLDGGETPKEATFREAKEEAGIDVKMEDIEFVNVTHSFASKGREYIQFYFVCKKWMGEIINMEEDRCYEMKFCKLNNLPENTTPYIRQAIENYLEKKIYDEMKD